tara:strand:+ start:1134 stop:2108 length:975 start_codon:yes stop_codon:yes gene_type:complete
MRNKLIINSPARLHIGFLDLQSQSSRMFGSIGLTIDNFVYNIKIEKSKNTHIICQNLIAKSKIKEIIKSIKKKYSIGNFTINILNEIPLHTGLGSGTQLALSIGFLISECFELKLSTDRLALILKRGRRSGVGIESFKKGGVNIDVGKIRNSKKIPLNLMNIKWPKAWRILLLMDSNITGVHGKKEIKEFKELNVSDSKMSNLNCKSLVMNIIPGIIECNFREFSFGLRNIQDNMSTIFYGSPRRFASKNLEKIFSDIEKRGILSFGQSSWGPTGFIFFENSKKRNELLNYLENYISLNNMHGLKILKVEGRNFGKKIVNEGDL